MKTVFIGGSRNISRLNTDVLTRLDNVIENNLHVLIGDANGADKAVQRYFYEKAYRNVEVFCVGGACRNNVGMWNVRAIHSESRERDFAFYSAKDRIMTHEADVGLMVWDGKSAGTLLNVFRLLHDGKKVVVYVSPERQFFELRNTRDWEGFAARCDPTARRKVEQKAAQEIGDGRKPVQTRLAV
jgi:hypothetical protein